MSHFGTRASTDIGDGAPMPASTMSEAMVALGHLMRHLPAQSIEVDMDLGIRVTARTEAGFLRWASTIHAAQLGSGREFGFETRTATGEVAHIPATVIFHLAQVAS